MSIPERIIGKASSYREFISVLRAFFEEKQVSREVLDDHCSFTGGHAGKLFATIPTKHLGPTTMTLLLQQCGLELWIVQRPDSAMDALPKRQFKGGAVIQARKSLGSHAK